MELYYPIDVRLSAFRSELHWALVIECLVFNQQRLQHECPITEFWCFGDDLPQAPGRYQPELHFTSDGPSGPLFDQEEFDNRISASATDMKIRSKVVPITTNPVEYSAAGIELSNPPLVLGEELLRLIAPKHRRLFFCTEAEIVERIGESMPLLLRLDEWLHPAILDLPSESESFQMIADAIAQNDPSLYDPTEPPNTHWSNWPMAGSI